ncbi:MAG: hypothetical protein ACM4AI_14820 [Acidobacteriota bacterium]
MSRHLRSQEFIDALDGALPADRLEHLDACESCKTELSCLASLMTDVRGTGDVPDPSPLFWEHLSDRVRQATVAEPVPQPVPWWRASWRPFLAVAACAVVATLAVIWRMPPHQRDVAPALASVDSMDDGLSIPDDDPAVAFMAEAASDLTWEEARGVNLTPRRVAVDTAIERMTAAQRAELVRLIREEQHRGSTDHE